MPKSVVAGKFVTKHNLSNFQNSIATSKNFANNCKCKQTMHFKVENPK